jgi:ligand-binding sensor domain-containing protein
MFKLIVALLVLIPFEFTSAAALRFPGSPGEADQYLYNTWTTRDGLSDNNVTALMPDDRGNLWVGTKNGLNCLTDGKFRSYTVDNGLAHPHVTALCRDKRGDLLVGTIIGMSITSHLAEGKTFKSLDKPESSWIHSILEDRNGTIWIASDQGLYRVMPSTSTDGGRGDTGRFLLDYGFSSDKVISLYEDCEGTLWFGTMGEGFSNLYKSTFKFYTVNHGQRYFLCVQEGV